MSVTARLNLPYIAPQQAQKQVTYNEAMAALDQLVQPAVLSRTVAAPPGSPAEGDTYIVAPSATGAWAGKDGKFATFGNGGWSFRTPAAGWLAYVVDTAGLAIFQSGAWGPFLLTGRMTLNKASAADTASLLFEDNSSGRAELGLTGDDALHVKVSPDGSSWLDALTVAQASGLISLPIGQLAFPATANPSANANTLDDYREGSWVPTLQFGGASTGITYGAATLGRYTKIGHTVLATCVLTLTSKGSATGSAQIGGLPFMSLNDSIYSSVNVGWAANLSSVVGGVCGLLVPNSQRINLYHTNNGNALGLSNAFFTNTSAIYATVIYDS